MNRPRAPLPRRPCLILALCALLVGLTVIATGAAGQGPDPIQAIPDSVRLPDSASGRAFPSFLAAYNTGRFDRLRQFAQEHARPDGEGVDPDRFARYWSGIHNEYGPMTLVSVDATETRTDFWVRGQITCAWSIFVLDFADGPASVLTGWAVARGGRPPGLRTAVQVDPERLPEVLDPYLERLAARDHFAGAVAVARAGAVLFEGAYGMADRRHDIPNTPNTRFVIASVTKMLTAVAVLQLVQAGELALSDTLGMHVPEYPRRIASQVTVRHLLTHGSGIELDDYAPYNADLRTVRSVEQLLQTQLRHIDHLNQGPVDTFALAEGFDYTNEGYDLLGVIVERVSGQSWPDYVTEHVLEPAGMTRTGFHHDVPVPGLATGYTLGSSHPFGRRQESHSLLSPYARPSGGMFSTAGDLLRFLEALQAGRLLGAELTRAATSPHAPWTAAVGGVVRSSYGFGFQVGDVDGVRWYGHGGSLPGVGARARVYPDLGYSVVVLSNYDNAARIVVEHLHDLIGGTGAVDPVAASCPGARGGGGGRGSLSRR